MAKGRHVTVKCDECQHINALLRQCFHDEVIWLICTQCETVLTADFIVGTGRSGDKTWSVSTELSDVWSFQS